MAMGTHLLGKDLDLIHENRVWLLDPLLAIWVSQEEMVLLKYNRLNFEAIKSNMLIMIWII